MNQASPHERTLTASIGRQRLNGLMAIGLLALALSSCTANEQPHETVPIHGGVLRVGVFEPMDYMTPALDISPFALDILAHITPPLGRYNELGEVELMAARDWLDQGMTLQFKLKKLLWEDGTHVTALDFITTKRTLLHPSARSHQRSRFDFIKEFESVNDSTLRVQYLILYPNRYRDSMLSPLPHQILGDDPNGANITEWPLTEKPLSCGSFRVERSTARALSLRRRKDSGMPVPYLSGVEFSVFTEEAGLKAFRQGSLDVLDDVPLQRVAELKNVPDKNIVALVGRSYVFMGWNLRDARLADPAVRRAAAHAVDLDKMIKDCTLKQGDPARGPLVPAMGILDTTAVFSHDLQMARQGLAAAGWFEGPGGVLERRGARLSIQLLTPVDDFERQCACEHIKKDLAQIGLKVTIRPLPLEEFLLRLGDKHFDAFMGIWYPNTALRLREVWHSEATSEKNFVSYANAHVDSLLNRLLQERPKSGRNADILDLQRTVYRDQPYLFLFQNPKFIVFSRRVQGANPSLLGTYWNLPEWWLTAPEEPIHPSS